MNRTYVMAFDRTFAELTKEQFVEQVSNPLQVRGSWWDSTFVLDAGPRARRRIWKDWGKARFRVEVITPVLEGEIPVSSTRLREALADGDVATAAKILGRPYSLEGEVVAGDARGRSIGFPTANLSLSQPYMIPRRGVYLVSVPRQGRLIPV